MTTVPANGVIRNLRRALLALDRDTLTDGQLLERYLAQRDEAAFEALLRRHGPMILGVCRRILKNPADAEDAFQATFLVLVRKAATVLPRNRVGHWLYGVAYRTALKARSTTAKRQARERMMSTQEATETGAIDDWLPLLDHELNRLPEKYRLPVVLCDLEGKTRKQAARHLDWPEGTVATRLTRGRALLAQRLSRQGVTLTATALGLALARQAEAARMPVSLVSSTVRAATDYAAGPAAAAGFVPARVAALTEGVLKTMLLPRLKTLTAVVLALGLLGAGLGTSLHPAPAAQDEAPPVRRAVVPPRTTDENSDKSLSQLPSGPAPVQALLSMDESGALTAKTRNSAYIPVTEYIPNADGSVRPVTTFRRQDNFQIHHSKRGEYQAYNTKLKKLAPKDLRKLLQEETPALVCWVGAGQRIDPLHLRFIKDGTLIISLPQAIVPPAVAVPATVPPPASSLTPVSPVVSVPLLPPAPAANAVPVQAVPSPAPQAQTIFPPSQPTTQNVPAPLPSQPAIVPPSVVNPPLPSQPTNPTPSTVAPPMRQQNQPEAPHFLHLLRSPGGISGLMQKLEGTWEVVKQRRGDRDVSVDDLKGYKVVIGAGKMYLCRGNDLAHAKVVRIHVDTKKNPAEIDTFIQTEKGEQVSRGILEINGNVMAICEAPLGQPRPTKAGTGDYVTLYRRLSNLLQPVQ